MCYRAPRNDDDGYLISRRDPGIADLEADAGEYLSGEASA
jgi:hypothetical protein